jgi:predicted transcriptional regulator
VSMGDGEGAGLSPSFVAREGARAYVEHVQRRGAMLGIRLSAETERLLDRHARELGKPKSALARQWIVERLERESVDREMRAAAQILALHDREEDYIEADLDD